MRARRRSRRPGRLRALGIAPPGAGRRVRRRREVGRDRKARRARHPHVAVLLELLLVLGERLREVVRLPCPRDGDEVRVAALRVRAQRRLERGERGRGDRAGRQARGPCRCCTRPSFSGSSTSLSLTPLGTVQNMYFTQSGSVLAQVDGVHGVDVRRVGLEQAVLDAGHPVDPVLVDAGDLRTLLVEHGLALDDRGEREHLVERQAALLGDGEPLGSNRSVERVEHHPDEVLGRRGVLGVGPEGVGRRVQEALERRALGPDLLVEQPRVVAQEGVRGLGDELVERLGIDVRPRERGELGRHLLQPESLAEGHVLGAMHDLVVDIREAVDDLARGQVHRQGVAARLELRGELVEAGLEQEGPLAGDDPRLGQPRRQGGGRVAGLDRELDLGRAAARPAGSARRPGPRGRDPATKPIRRAAGLPSAQGTTASRTIGRANVVSATSTTTARTTRNSDEAEEPTEPAAAVAVAVVAALVARSPAVAPGALVAVGPLAAPVRGRDGHVLARTAPAPDAHRCSFGSPSATPEPEPGCDGRGGPARRASSSSWRMTLAASRSIRARNAFRWVRDGGPPDRPRGMRPRRRSASNDGQALVAHRDRQREARAERRPPRRGPPPPSRPRAPSPPPAGRRPAP